MKPLQYLLDTDVLIAMIKGQYAVRELILEVGMDSCAVSDISIAELYYDAYKGSQTENSLKQIHFIERNFTVVKVQPEEYGRIRASLETEGKPLDSMDILIASCAINNNLILVSHNTKHFSKIPNLRHEDWIGDPETILKQVLGDNQ